MWNFDDKYETDGFYIPDYMMSGIKLYVMNGIRPGSFLTSVLSNDFVGAIGNADFENIRNLPAYGKFLYNHIPSTCWGDRKAVKSWCECGGLEGIRK